MSAIKTITKYNETKFKEKGSVFIGKAYPVESGDQAEQILEEIRKEFYDATHHCFAWRAGDKEKYSDDGEPNGTAGIRILNAVNHFGLTNTLCVVIRYYGGTKLGVGPLGKAYYKSAEDTLSGARKLKKFAYREIEAELDYSYSSAVYRLMEKYNAKIGEPGYSDSLAMKAHVKAEKIDDLVKELTDMSRGSAEIKVSDKVVYLTE